LQKNEKNICLFQTNVLNFSIKQLFKGKTMDILQKNEVKNDPKMSVQDRLLNAAEELFCEHGFYDTSVRKIAARASCNIASVNYYFGSKDKLYHEVWRRHLSVMRDTRLASIEKVMSQKDGNPSLEDLLASYANAFVEPLVDRDRSSRFIKLMAREMVDKKLPQNVFIEEMIIPVMNALQQALMKICRGLDKEKAPLVILSLVGQLVHTTMAETMLEQGNETEIPRFDLAEIIKHIVKFSAAGIRAYVKEKTA
jgi:AcrR family transcriptional regulator